MLQISCPSPSPAVQPAPASTSKHGRGLSLFHVNHVTKEYKTYSVEIYRRGGFLCYTGTVVRALGAAVGSSSGIR